LVDLGFRHARRGVLAEHYPIVGQSLMNTLKAGLKKQFTPQVKKAWDIVFKIVSDTMMSDFYNNPDQLSDELTDQKIEILQNSWNSVLQLGEYEVGCLLFKNLFEFGPDLISLFNFTND
jgi:hemoglobin-like flavoprotein